MNIVDGFVRFFRGLRRMPLYVHAWLFVLASVNTVPGILWIEWPIARVVVGVFLLNFLLMIVLTARFGFTRILGLGHFPWFALNAYLLIRLPDLESAEMRLWILATVVLNFISLAIDTVDVVRWLRGERDELVEGLD